MVLAMVMSLTVRSIHRHALPRVVRVQFFVLSLLLYFTSCLGGMLEEYFYIQNLQSTERHHVQEYLATSGNLPDFLYSPSYPNGRIVEFYAHWCPHCQHFKPKYIELSNKLYDLAKQLDTKVEVFAVSCVPNKDLCKDQHIKGYPTTRFFPPHSINATEVNAWKLHPHDVMRMVGVSVQQQGGGGDAKTPTVVSAAIQDNNSLRRQQEKEKGGKTPHFMYRSKRQVFDDAHLSFEFAMKTAIFTSPGPLSEKVRNVLKLFLENLQKTLPITSSIQPVINDLVQNFDSVAEDDANLHAILEKHPSPTKTWSPAATQHGTGYTNGLWTLFHIMSVGFVVWNHGAIDQSQKLIPSKVADNVRDYVEHFFQCEVCRLHFLSEYDSCSFDRCNRLATNQRGNLHQDIQFPLWLYETHNAVNVRLRGERIKLHDEPEWLTTEAEVMWPSDKSCPTCWISEGRWDESHIFQFLYNYYWPETDSDVLREFLYNDVPAGKSHHETFEEEMEGAEIPIFVVAIVFIFAGMIWFWRKQMYDRKGIHKKKDTHVSRCK